MPYSMSIVDYSIFLFGNVDIHILVFLANSLGNVGVDMVSPLMVSLHPIHHIIDIIFRDNDNFYLMGLAFNYLIL